MIEDKIQIPTSTLTAEGILYRPEEDGRWPGVIQYTDIGGIRASQQEMARRLAGAGLRCAHAECVLPHRTAATVRFSPEIWRRAHNEAAGGAFRSPDSRGHREQRFKLCRLSPSTRLRQSRFDGRGGILLHR